MPAAPPAPAKPAEAAPAKPEPSVGGMIDKFKSRMVADTPPKPATPVAPVAPEPKLDTKPTEPKSLVPKLEPMPEKKPEAEPITPAAEPAKGDVIPEKLSHKNFKEVLALRDEFRTKYETAEKRAKELEAKLQEQSTRTPPELEETKKQLAEKELYIKQFMLERSPEFQNAFDRPIEQTIQDAKEALGGERGDKLERILRAPDDQWRADRIKEFVGELEDDYEKGSVRDAFNNLRKLQRSRRDELSKANENIKALEQHHGKQAEEQAQRQKEFRTKLFQNALSEGQRGLMEFRETGDAEHDKLVTENRELLQTFLTSDLPPEEYGRMAVWAVRGHRSLAMEKQLTDKIAMLESEIVKLSSASPDLDGEGGGGANPEKADTAEKMGSRFVTAMNQGVPPK